jgi:hypothetical protein
MLPIQAELCKQLKALLVEWTALDVSNPRNTEYARIKAQIVDICNCLDAFDGNVG